MKKISLLLVLFIVVFAGCKKETTAPETPDNPFAANESLISKNAELYFIADVEGIAGVSHVNQQDTIWGVTPQWSSGYCSNVACSYGGGLGDISSSNGWVFKAQYNGSGETHEQLLVQNYTTFITPANEHHGIELYYQYNGKYYYSNISDNSVLNWANISIVSRDSTGEPNTPTSTPYYVKLHFNCELTNATNSSEKIKLKNAVARVKM